ncbi:hypothetical protein RZS08_53960, partial [Arthrospira platensis SPKY1]|nr:hypothetical protein [Arthrospira platensis SPKY1]
QAGQSERKQAIGGQQHGAPAQFIDGAAGTRPHHCRDQQRQREGREHLGLGHAQLDRHRGSQQRRQVVRRSPGQRLCGAQPGHHAPLAGHASGLRAHARPVGQDR